MKDAGRISKDLAAEIDEKQFEIYAAKLNQIENEDNIAILERDIKSIATKKATKK